ncbi:hypothetical protein B0T14DRAFT_497122 [Immersiella caudata]|uniref:Uncharacterized protein n=1 Tax=Immersiella caudata TaxID=314043 RepID=A0AA39WSB5_9PEZI|nr:hypothetical protein B0T14DRAFT_497122 [Immersiella caudata]
MSSAGGLSTKNSFGSSKSGKRPAPAPNKSNSSFTHCCGLRQIPNPASAQHASGVLLGRGARLVGRSQSPFVAVRQARGYNQHGVLSLSMSERSGSTQFSGTSVESARAAHFGCGARLDDAYDYAGHAQTPVVAATQQTYGTRSWARPETADNGS